MVKPLLELDNAECQTATRVTAVLVAEGNGHLYWDVFIYTLSQVGPIAHDPIEMELVPIDGIGIVIDEYLRRLHLVRREKFIGQGRVWQARIRPI